MKRRIVRAVLLIAIFASLGGVAYKVAHFIEITKLLDIRKNPIRLFDHVPQAALQVKNFTRTKIEDGQKVWEISGEEASYLKEKKEAVVKKARVTFYDKSGESIEATGEEARLFFADEEMDKAQLRGDIQLHYKGFVLQTDEIVYIKSKDQVVSPGKVTLTGDGLELEGVGMEMALTEQKIRLLKQVRTRLVPERLAKKRTREHDKGKNKL